MTPDIVTKNSILSESIAARKIRRMAFEIAEHNASEKSLIILGIEGNGAVVAKSLIRELGEILTLPIEFATISINKKLPLDATLTEGLELNDAVVIVVDDVSNTGRTLLYALKPLLDFTPKKIQTLVLVERSHKLFAVQPDYVGLSVSTTLQEHISVAIDGEKVTGAWLH